MARFYDKKELSGDVDDLATELNELEGKFKVIAVLKYEEDKAKGYDNFGVLVVPWKATVLIEVRGF